LRHVVIIALALVGLHLAVSAQQPRSSTAAVDAGAGL
jgi:hypothetical protein